MATITKSNLYPPMIDTYMPAFLIDGENESKKICRVYFSISSFNSLSDIKNAQVTVKDNNTNVSVLDEKKYPSGVILTEFYEDTTKTSEDRYYVEIKPEDLEEGQFEIDTYYKVQIRFTSRDAENVILTPPQAIDSWLAANLGEFSEWSTVCLIRGISTPILTMKRLDDSAESTVWTTSDIDLIGSLSFLNPLETETLKSYRIKLYNANKEIVVDTQDLYSNNYNNVNEINYTLNYYLQDGETYSLEIQYITRNLYTETKIYNFTVIEGTTDKLEATLSAILDPDNGRIGIRVLGTSANTFLGNVTIRRTSSESNFTYWEDVHTESLEVPALDFTWYDYTVKSGVWYKYCAQRRNGIGNRGIVVMLNEPQMIVLDDIFLIADQKQLKIRFNPQISAYKRTVLEAKTDTIGSKYPFVKRNGYANYREFSLSGLISCFMDYNYETSYYIDSTGRHTDLLNQDFHDFISKEELYKDSITLYQEYNNKNKITDFNDFTYERDFREKVLDFLYANNIKLFRSPTEGNMLVKLMNITLTPDTVLGRRVYTFSCTAYEIDDFNIINCDFYNIQPIGSYSNALQLTNNYIGQLYQVIPENIEILDLLNEKYSSYAQSGYEMKVEYLSYLKIEMQSPPYPIIEKNGIPVFDENPSEKSYLGYIVYINNIPVAIAADGFYELKHEDVKITSIVFPVEVEALINYDIIITQTESLKELIGSANYYKIIGQLSEIFKPKESVYQQIASKYYEKTEEYIQYMLTLNAIKIEADPGAVVYVKESNESDYNRHIIGETALLEIYNEDSVIEDFYFENSTVALVDYYCEVMKGMYAE